MRIDLHLHSNASDGALSPTALVRRAREVGLDLIALADHDTTAGVAAALAEADGDPVVVPAIEVSTTHEGADLHILGYRVDPEHEALHEYTRKAAEGRRERMRAMVERLRGLGVDIDFEDVAAVAGPDAEALGRPHLAQALLDRGHVRTYAEAFDRYIADDGPAYLPARLTAPADAIDLIHEVGGVAVWAHPPMRVFESELDRFVEWGLDGVECIRPRNTASATRRFARATREHDLVITGGSDWHGEWSGPLGEFHVTPAEVAGFLARIGLRDEA